MISLLRGMVAEISGQTVTLEVGGVGYEVICSRECCAELLPNTEAQIVIATDVKQDSIKLYGFTDRLEKQVFLLLTQVKGVGARSGSDILSRIDKRELLRIIGAGDLAKLQAIKGIGKKTAERIVVELKDKVSEFAAGRQYVPLQVEQEVIEPFEDAVRALQALGFSTKDAKRAVGEVQSRDGLKSADSGKIVKEALRFV